MIPKLVVVDSSVWIDHLKNSIPVMDSLLVHRRPLLHPFAKGEILVGNMRHRSRVRSFLDGIEAVPLVENAVVLEQLELWRAFDRGIGWIDMHMLSSTHAASALLWTRDKRLGTLAESLGLRFHEM